MLLTGEIHWRAKYGQFKAILLQYMKYLSFEKYYLKSQSGMGRDRKFSRRDKTRQTQNLENVSRRDKSRHWDKNMDSRQSKTAKMHVETSQDFQVLWNLISRQVETFKFLKTSRQDGTRQHFLSCLGREIGTRLNFQV